MPEDHRWYIHLLSFVFNYRYALAIIPDFNFIVLPERIQYGQVYDTVHNGRNTQGIQLKQFFGGTIPLFQMILTTSTGIISHLIAYISRKFYINYVF